MKGMIAALLAVPVLLALPPTVEASAARACADQYSSMGLGPYPPVAETTSFFWGAEGSGSFSVRWTGVACNQPFKVNAEYSDVPGSATEPTDYDVPSGQRTPDVCEVGCPSGTQATVTIGLEDDSDVEPVVESFTIVLSNPLGGVLSPPSSVPFLIVDGDGLTRVAFDELAYDRSESYPMITVPVWRAGPVTGTSSVPYAVGPGPGAPATENDDYIVTSPNPLVFNPGERVKAITLSIVNDKLSEPEETVQLTLQSPTGAGLDAPSTKVVTILDNEENVPPKSRFHHPRHKWKYKKSDFRIREFHVFTSDEEGGSGVAAVELALRRNFENGKCAWKAKKGWQKKDCQSRTWLPTKYSAAGELFYYRMTQLKSSVNTKIKNYTAFSRAIDGAGNVEKEFKEKRNDNTFEIKRTKKRR